MNSLIKLLPLISISASIDLVAVAAEPSLDFVERAQAIDAELARCESGNELPDRATGSCNRG